MSKTSISVVIRTFNSARTLKKVISALHLKAGDEVIAVDSGSTDSTVAIATQLGAKVLTALGPFNYSKSLNLGFSHAKNPWVLVLSSHCIPLSSDFFEIHRNEIIKFPNSVVVGYAPATFSGKSDSSLPQDQTSFYFSQDYLKVSGICGNGNTIYRRSAWEECQFDESARTTEDKLWLMEIIKRGYGFAYVPAPKCLSRNQANWAYMYRKGYSDSRAARDATHKPMTPWQLGGTIKNITKNTLDGELDWKSWARCSAHAIGQFIGSYQSENNSLNFKKIE